MSKGIDLLRDRYQELRTRAYNNEMKKVTYKDVKKYKQEASRQIDKMQTSGVFENLEEADFYRDKFAQLENAMQVASKNKMSMKDFTLQAKQIFKDKGFASRNSYLNQAPIDPKVTSQPVVQSRMLQSFFEQKRSKIVPDVGFRSLLQNPPISPKNFKKRIGANNDQIARLRSENQQLRRQIQSGNLGSMNDSNLEIEIRKQQQRIRYLENQNDRLSRDNTKLRSQKSVTVYTSQQPTYQDYLYSPYIINPRENDLLKIGMRTSEMDTNSYYNQGFGNEYNQIGYSPDMAENNFPSFGSKANNGTRNQNFNYETASQIGEYQRNKDQYSVFDMSHSRYSDYGTQDDNFYKSSGSSGVDDPRTAVRNKIAFFRNSGMLVREQELEIAYKRSQSNNLTSNRVILYFNNKSGKPKRINVNYSFEPQYYDLNVTQKIIEIQAFKQGRQVVEVRLRGERSDINSLIEANVMIDGMEYKLWLPAIFIKFTNPKQGMMESSDKRTKMIYLSKIFANQIQAQKVIPELSIRGRGQGYVWGISPIYEGPVRLSWKAGNKLQVSTSQRWIDFISFLLFEYH